MLASVLSASWRVYPAVALVLVGAAVVWWGFVREGEGLRRAVTDPRLALALACCLRTTIFGLAVAAVGAGWYWQVSALIGLALVIVGEEMLEISVVVAALRRAPGVRARESAAGRAATVGA